MKITLRVFEGSEEILTKSLGEGVFRAGRSEFCDLVLPSDQISRSHVEFRVNEAAIYFTNMSGPGQVKVNNRGKETGELADGDELVLGPYRVVVSFGDPPEVQAPEQGLENDGGPVDDAANAEGDGLGGFGGEGAMDEGGQGMGGFGAGAPADGDEADAGGGGDAQGFGMDNAAFGVAFGEGAVLQTEDPNDQGALARLKEITSGGRSASLAVADTDVEMKPVVAKLVFTEGPKAGDELVLEAYEVTFGRSKKADIYLDDDRLSRLHAKIVRVGMGFRLVDLDSRNGTFVNGMRVLEHPLSSFDEIQFGDTKIKFLIHDILLGGMDSPGSKGLVGQQGALALDQTESVAIGALAPEQLMEIESSPGGGKILEFPGNYEPARGPDASGPSRRNQFLFGAVLALLLMYLVIPNGETPAPQGGSTAVVDKLSDVKIPPSMPKEYGELGEDVQRAVEGHYNSALKSADVNDFESAVDHLKSIHQYLPYYKKSRELIDRYGKKLKEKQIAEAQEKAKNDEKQDLAMYLQDGVEYLKEGDFARAGEAFNSAIVIDPSNTLAAKGLKAADAKVRDIDKLPPEVDPEMEKRRQVLELFQAAVAALQQKQYQQAIDRAEQVRRIELKGDTQYLNEAKQIIDQAKILQKEEFEPFLIAAKEKYAEGDYTESRNLCEEMLNKDSSYEEARECVLKARKNLNRLAKEAYTHGYILESMNRIDEAKQYWNRARNYVRPGDDYYDKVTRKLDYYQ